MSRPDCPSPVGSIDALRLHLVREVDRDGLRKTERLVEKVYKSDIANSASKLHKKPGLILFDSVGSGRLIPSRTTEPPMDWTHVQEIADKKVLYLTTIGRRTGLPREIEIWFVVYRDCFYLFADTGEAAAWVKNIRSSPEVTVRIGEQHFGAVARVLDRDTDRELWDQVAALAERKYGWGDGLLVEIGPFPPRTTDPDPPIEPTERG